MPIDRPTAVDALHLDAVLTLDVVRGLAVIDLAQVSFVDAYALTGLACFIATHRPKLVSSRHQARELTSSLASDLSGSVVMVDCTTL